MVEEESSPSSGSGNEVPQNLKLFCTFVGIPNILKNGHRNPKCVFRCVDIVINKKNEYMEFSGIYHKLLKQGLFNLSVNWSHFQKRSSLGSLEVGDARVYIVDRVGK